MFTRRSHKSGNLTFESTNIKHVLHPDHRQLTLCSIPSPTAPRDRFQTLWVFVQSAHMSENRPNQVSIIFLNEKASKKSLFFSKINAPGLAGHL